MCAVLGLSASSYCAWRGRPESQRSVANHALTKDIRLIHAESSGCFGSPRVHATLRRHVRRIGLSRVEQLMRRAGLRGLAALPCRARTTDSRYGYPIAPNLLARNFQPAAPNQIWLAHLTYVPTGGGWL
jgi:putative transposase